MSEQGQTDTAIHCAVCGNATRVPGYGQCDDEQPTADQMSGRVARDDFFREP